MAGYALLPAKVVVLSAMAVTAVVLIGATVATSVALARFAK